MCRLFCWAANQPVSPIEVLGSDSKLLHDLSLEHKDGWGGASCNSGVVKAVHDIESAAESSSYSKFLEDSESTSGMIHLRWATGDYLVCLENTHPFVADGMAFEHNGAFQNIDSIIQLIDPKILSGRQGTVDSEIYFYYLRTLLQTRNMKQAYEELIPVMEKQTAYTSLNAMILSPTKLYVISAHSPERRPKDLAENYYDLSFNLDESVFSAWSRGVRAIEGTKLPNNHILTVDLADISLDISALDLKG
jgi:predicted glutamine amidotransferase